MPQRLPPRPQHPDAVAGHRSVADSSPADALAWRQGNAIDLSSDFVWIDDDPLLAEVQALRSRGLLGRLLIVDSDEDLLAVMGT